MQIETTVSKPEQKMLILTRINDQLQGVPDSLKIELIQSLLKHEASLAFRERCEQVRNIRTPPNVLRQTPGGINRTTGVRIQFTTVQLGWMEQVVSNYITPHIIPRTIVPPHLEVIQGNDKAVPTYVTHIEIDFYIWGQLVSTIPATGCCEVPEGFSGGINTAIKGCVTDAYKKGFSYLGVCSDVYDYGDSEELNESIVHMYYNTAVNKYAAVIQENQKNDIFIYLKASASVRSLRDRYFKMCDKLEKKLEFLNREKEHAVSDAETEAIG